MVIKPQQTSVQQPLTDEYVTSVNFFDADIAAIDNEKLEADKLFNELHGIFSNTINGQYVQTRSVRDIAEFARTLVQARTLCIDAVTKKHSIKKNIADMVTKQKNAESEIDASVENVKLMLKVLKQDGAENYGLKTYKDIKKPPQKGKKPDDLEQLDRIVQQKINSSEIKLSKNDKLISLANHVEIRYHRKKRCFVPVDTRNNSIIQNFPEERLPNATISRFSNTHAYTNTGEVYALYSDKGA